MNRCFYCGEEITNAEIIKKCGYEMRELKSKNNTKLILHNELVFELRSYFKTLNPKFDENCKELKE